MGDRDPFRLPPSNPFILNYLTQTAQTSPTGQPLIPTTTGLPVDTGTGRVPTRQTASNAYAMQRALEQQLMTHLLQNVPRSGGGLQPETVQELEEIFGDTPPLAGEPGLQFDDPNMTIDPNQTAEELGIPLDGSLPPGVQEEVDDALDGQTSSGMPQLDIDEERVEELGAELRLRVDGDDINDDDLERLAGLSTDERVATLSQLSPEQLQKLGDQLPDQDDTKAGEFLAALAQDAEAHPDLVRGQFGSILEGIQQDGSNDSDNVLHRMQETLGGGDVENEENAAKAAGVLRHLGEENLGRMAQIHSGGNTDEKELAVIGRARGLAAGLSDEAAGLNAELVKRIGDEDIDSDILDQINNASPEDRLAVLSNLSQEELETLAYHATDEPDQMGDLMASLVLEAENDPQAAQIVGHFANGLNSGHTSRDNVLHRMQEQLGGGDVENSDNRRAAARALSYLAPETLDKMVEAHEGGNRDDKELDVIALARELQ